MLRVAPPALPEVGAAWLVRAARGGPGGHAGLGPRWSVDADGTVAGWEAPAHADRCGVAFHGVLHNRQELVALVRRPLSAFRSDGELVLEGYRQWGEEVFSHLAGMFSVVIRDSRRDVLLCARDRVGMSPLFYAQVGPELVCSTSVEALVAQAGISRGLNRAALADHLAQRWPYPEETYYAAIRRVPPGSVLRVDGSGSRLFRYWSPVPENLDIDWLDEEALERFDGLLESAIKRCLEVGRPAIFLSGGLDSVSVAAVATDLCRRQGRATPLALSLAFPYPECNEEEVQAQVARDLGLPQVLMPLGEAVGPEGLLWATIDLCRRWPVPILNPWRPAYFRLAHEGSEAGCAVILTGAGGDEWFGVSPNHVADLIRRLDLASLYRLLGSMLRSYRLPRLAMLRFLLWASGVQPVLRLQGRRLLRFVAPGYLRTLRRDRQMALVPDWAVPDPGLRREIERRAEESAAEGDRRRDPEGPYGFYFRGLLDSFGGAYMSMELEEDFEAGRHTGLPIRMPYWDGELIEFLCRVPPKFLLRGGREKGLVRRVAARRFPRLGFERQRKVTAMNFFKDTTVAQGWRAWERMGGVPALVDLGLVDGGRIESEMQTSLASSRVVEVDRVPWLLNLESWVRAHR